MEEFSSHNYFKIAFNDLHDSKYLILEIMDCTKNDSMSSNNIQKQ